MMNSMLLPPGFRFHPTDEELVGYYLKRKVDGLEMELEVIPVINLYKFDPWELPDKSFLPKRDLEWFFFCLRDRKYPNGSRTNRATVSGYWKATGKDRKVECDSSIFGLRKTLVFYIGRAPGGERTDWIMHEYRLCEDLFQGSSNFLGAFSLCRVVKRNANWLKGCSDPVGDSKTKKCASSPSSSSFSSVIDAGARKRGFDEVLNGAAEGSFSLSLKLLDSGSGASAINSPEAATGAAELLRPTLINLAEIGKASSAGVVSNSIQEACPPCDPSLEISYRQEAYESDSMGMGMFSNTWDDNLITFQSLQWDASCYSTGIQTFNTVMPLPPPICRQASEVEEVNLWFHEEHNNTVPVM